MFLNIASYCFIIQFTIGASEPQHMAYMVRLGLWGNGTEFENFPKFQDFIEQRYSVITNYVYIYSNQICHISIFLTMNSGVGLMEICAMDMKLRGMYMARQLSFKAATFENREIAISPQMKKIYDDSVELVMNSNKFSLIVFVLMSHEIFLVG